MSTITGGGRVLITLQNLRGALADTVGRTVYGFGLDVLNLAKKGTPWKTGRLRRSVHLEMDRQPSRIVGIVGTNVEYAAQFEYGFKGTETVRPFIRRQTMVFGRPCAPRIVEVRGFTRNVNRPARPFLAPALAAARPTLADRLRDDLRSVPGVTR